MITRRAAAAVRNVGPTHGHLLSLPPDLAENLLKLLNRAEHKGNLALTCQCTAGWLRCHRKAVKIHVLSERRYCQALVKLAHWPSLTSLQIVAKSSRAHKPKLNLSLRSLRLVPHIQTLVLCDCLISARSLSQLALLPHLTSLTLDSSDTTVVKRRLNQDGCFAALAAMPRLRSFTATNVASDSGLQLCTQLTSISLKLPDHAPDYEDLPFDAMEGFVCDNCGEVHDEDVDAMLQAYTNWEDKVSVGRNLHGLSSLQHLEVNFVGECCGINTVLNTLDLGPGGCLAGLTTLTLLNTSMKDFRKSLLACFDALPSLARLEAEFEANAYWLNWPGDSKDAAGRDVKLFDTIGRRWVLERSFSVAEE